MIWFGLEWSQENRGCKGKGKAKLRSSISYIIIIITDGRFGLGKKINFQLRLEFSLKDMLMFDVLMS